MYLWIIYLEKWRISKTYLTNTSLLMSTHFYHQVSNVDVDEFGQKLARPAINVIQHSAVEWMLKQRQYVEEGVQLGF